MQKGYHKGGVSGTVMAGTRVTKHGKETPIAGSPQKRDALMKGGRVAKAPGLPRRNDPVGKSAASLGLKVGARVTGYQYSGPSRQDYGPLVGNPAAGNPFNGARVDAAEVGQS